jgi:hypothetical protein
MVFRYVIFGRAGRLNKAVGLGGTEAVGRDRVAIADLGGSAAVVPVRDRIEGQFPHTREGPKGPEAKQAV